MPSGCENRRSPLKLPTISIMSSLTFAPCNSIRSICAACRASDRIRPSGFRPSSFYRTDRKGILFLDELTSAPQMTQAGCYQLVLDRKLGEYCSPKGGSSSPPAIRLRSVACTLRCRGRCATGLFISNFKSSLETGGYFASLPGDGRRLAAGVQRWKARLR